MNIVIFCLCSGGSMNKQVTNVFQDVVNAMCVLGLQQLCRRNVCKSTINDDLGNFIRSDLLNHSVQQAKQFFSSLVMLEKSSESKNTIPLGLFTKKLVMDLDFSSVQPSLVSVHPVLFHSFLYLSKPTASILSTS